MKLVPWEILHPDSRQTMPSTVVVEAAVEAARYPPLSYVETIGDPHAHHHGRLAASCFQECFRSQLFMSTNTEKKKSSSNLTY